MYKNNKIYKIKDIYCWIVFSFPIWNTLLYYFTSAPTRNNIMRIFTVLFFFITNKYLLKTNQKKTLIMNFLILINLLYVYYKIGSLTYLFHMDVYLFSFLIISLFIWTEKNIYEYYINFIQNHKKVLILNTWLTMILLATTLLNGTGFIASQRTIIFKGFFNIEHSLAYHLVVSYIMLLCSEKNNNKKHLPGKALICIFIALTGVRSAFIALSFLLILDFIYMKKWQKIIIIFLVGLSCIYIFITPDLLYNVPIITKTAAAAEVGDIENGRNELNEQGINYYKNKTTIIEKIFGITMNNLRKVYWNGLHAHNDFINILLGYGLLYLIIVIFLICKLFKGNNFLFAIGVIASLALFNGMFMYPELMISFPLIKYSIQKKKNRKED